ncbi:MAG: Gfo/Idh/MocA family oxidoreductase [Jannaschia sp.]
MSPFRYALIGNGMVAEVFHRAAEASGGMFEISTVLGRSAEGRARAEGAYGVSTVATLDALIATAPEAVILATPPDARAEIVAACADAGLPVLSEKPLERTTVAAEALVARMGSLPYGITLQHRMRPGSQAARRLISDGEVGAPRLLRVDVPWWRDPSYYNAPGRGTYARDGGGVLLTQAIHTLDLGLWLMGGAVIRVQGQTFRALHELEAEDAAIAGLGFDDGAAGLITATTAAFPGHPEMVEVICERATLRLVSGQLTILHRDGRTETSGEEGGTGSGADPMAFPHDWHQAVLSDFAMAVRDARPPAIPAASALPVHRVIDAITTSAREGRAIDIQGGIP